MPSVWAAAVGNGEAAALGPDPAHCHLGVAARHRLLGVAADVGGDPALAQADAQPLQDECGGSAQALAGHRLQALGAVGVRVAGDLVPRVWMTFSHEDQPFHASMPTTSGVHGREGDGEPALQGCLMGR